MLLTLLLSTLSWLAVPLLLIVLFTRRTKTDPHKLTQQDYQRDQLWQSYLASFREVVKTDKEKHLMDTLIQGTSAYDYSNGMPLTAVSIEPNHTQAVILAAAPLVNSTATNEVTQPPDNTILLLYFGAFLLIASVGLFVAIGGLDGLTRTIIVGITAAVLYFGGLWLYKTSKKLAQAGISFVGTGLIIAPLTGVAWYNLVSGQTNGGPVWFLTSVVCIALFAHAFTKIKNGFIAYLLIGSFVSSIESAVMTINLPAYAYTWGLLTAALLLAFNSRGRGQASELNRTGDVSSQLLIPLSVLGSIVLLPQFGSIQLAITLFLAGVYYSLLVWWQSKDQKSYSIAAQVSFIAAVASAVFATQRSLVSTSITLIVVTALYSVGIMVASRKTLKSHSLVEIAAVTSFLALSLSIQDPWPFVAGLGLATILGTIVWQKLRSQQALEVAALLLVGFPFVIGQYALQDNLGSWSQLVLCALSAGLLGGLVVVATRLDSFKPDYAPASIMYILATALLLIPAAALGFGTLGSVTFIVIASFTGLHYLAKDSNWLLASALAVLIPLFFALLGFGIDSWRFSVAVGVALIWNIGVSLAIRQALVRWLAVGCLLITPFAIGGGGLGLHWGAAGYAGGYLLVMLSCIAARAIARGKLLVSVNVPIAGYYAEASQAYVMGYLLAGIIAIAVSLADAHSQLVTTLTLGIIALSVIGIAKIERNNQLLALLPLVMQGVLLSGIRPDVKDGNALGLTAIISVLAAAGAYAIVPLVSSVSDNLAARSTQLMSVAMAYIGPLLALAPAEPSLLLPVSLFMAGLLTFGYNRLAKQSVKELSIGVCIASIQWLVFLMGYTNIHVHTHMIALYLAGFAFWRNALNDSSASQNYIQALFFVVTIPLVFQSLSGASGGPYGLTLIGEQVGFMIIGASFGQRFLLRWGLWTALAAVLFQLRGLGWAFLSMLALIIIGTAVYRLQKHTPNNS